ncbi:Hypothetical predicted protein [Scomber scombrus]|uniref:Uncharacterized protein n=1 Tax=Scomber scombrus TaxID=13677 RepID=A0AAV1MU17_SCOSC
MGAEVVQGPEKGEGKHLVTPLFLPKLLEVRRQQGWKSREHCWTAASCGSEEVIGTPRPPGRDGLRQKSSSSSSHSS